MSNTSFVSVVAEGVPETTQTLGGVPSGTSTAAAKVAMCVRYADRAIPVQGVTDSQDAVLPGVGIYDRVPVVARLIGWNGIEFDRVRVQGDNADSQNPIARGSVSTTARLTGFNGSTYDRVRVQGDDADLQAPIVRGSVSTTARLTGFNGSTFDRVRVQGDNTDAQATIARGSVSTTARLTGFNGVTFDRVRTASASTLAAANGVGAIQVGDIGNWSISAAPASGGQAILTRAGEPGRRHVITSIAFSLSAAAAQTHLGVELLDGTTVIWQIGVAALAGDSKQFALSGLSIVAGAGNAVTLRFSAAPAAANTQRLSLTGYTAQ